jgi:hypothetical protein
MRGWPTLFTKFTKEQGGRYRTGILVASAEPDSVRGVLQKAQLDFPDVAFSFLAPRAYQDIVVKKKMVVWLEDAKRSPLGWLLRTRRQRFDLAILVWAGQPTFRKAKLAGLLLNPCRWVIYDENDQTIIVDRANWKRLLRLIATRWSRHRPGPLLHPVGWIYLLLTTIGLVRRTKHFARVDK